MTNPLYDRLFGAHLGSDSAFLHLAGEPVLTHDAFLRLAGQFANALCDLGLVAGDRLAVQVEKCAEMLALYAACVQRGIVFLPLNTAYTGAELHYFIADSGARVVVCRPESETAVRSAAEELDVRLETLAAGRGSLADLAAVQADKAGTVARTGGDLAALLYTSGTTGRSKGAMLTQDNLLSNANVLAECWRFGPSDVLLHALPIFHTHGLFVATNVTLLTGGSMIFLPRFDIDEVIAALPDATAMMGVPTFYTRLLEDPRFTRDRIAHMRLFVSGSAPLLVETHTRFERRTGHRILERYGMTETNMTTSNPYDGERRPGTVGFPLPEVELRVADTETGEAVPQGEIGMIEVRGPNVFAGYWQMPEKTAAEFRADGFFITGDLGRVEEDGYVQIVGREKDLVITGGLNVYPKEVEDFLDRQPGVAESAVIGVAHPDMGEAIVGVLVPETDAGPDLEAIEQALGATLARFKHPRHFEVVDALPRNTMGKVQKAVLRERYSKVFDR